MTRDTKTIMNPYVFPGLMIDTNEKRRILSEEKYKHYKLSKEDLLQIIAEEGGVRMSDIVKRSRKREIVNARFIFCAILKDHFNYTLVRIGDEIDGRDHTSVRHAITEFRNRLQTEDDFKSLVTNIYDRIGIQSK